MVKSMIDSEKDSILMVADLMSLAAKTSPKGSGKDTVEAVVVTGEDKDALRDKMLAMADSTGITIFARDSKNVDKSEAVVIIGCKSRPFGLNCSMCGFENCTKMREAGSNCVFNITDLGIAVGSAVSVAMDHRVDNRVMYTVGRSALRLGLLSDEVKVCWGIPLSAYSKDIYFDRAKGMQVNLD